MTKRRVAPSLWADWKPFGMGNTKPHHFTEIAKTVWENRRHPLYAWRILTTGVCDGCALGTTGLRDWTIDSIHLCTLRLNLLKLNTMEAMPWERLRDDLPGLRSLSSAQLRDLGRLPVPLVRRRGDAGFQRVSWDEALDLIAARMRQAAPERIAFYLTSRGLTNEVYYVAQKAARFIGTNHVDNAARVCHSPSTVALAQTVGVGASSVSYKDWLGTDLITFIGSDIANNQPVTTKYLYEAKKQFGTRVAVVNPYREPGMAKYWVPSSPESAVMGTRLMDEFYQIHTGGDIGFLNGTLKYLMEQDWIDHAFIAQHTTGWAELVATLAQQDWETLERYSGASRADMRRFAESIHSARTGIFVWSMGITQHTFGVQNVKAIVNLALSQGWLGKPHCGIVPIRGHSGVQGGAEVGAVPNALPGGTPLTAAGCARFGNLWGFEVPQWTGLKAVQMLDAAHDGLLDVLYCSGGNFLEVLPEPAYVQQALRAVPLRVHQDIYVTTQMLVDPAETVVLLPAQTRYEQRGGGTETTTERRIIFSPYVPGPQIGEARAEWEIFQEVAARVHPEARDRITFADTPAIRAEIAQAMPTYAGIERLRRQGDQLQYGGRLLYEGGKFATPDGLGHFSAVAPPELDLPDGRFLLSTRRGKQFNSLILGKTDPLTGVGRDRLFMAEADALALGLGEGDPVEVRADNGAALRLRVHLAAIKPRNLQAFWPEANTLIDRHRLDVAAGVPDYNALVAVVPLTAEVAGKPEG